VWVQGVKGNPQIVRLGWRVCRGAIAYDGRRDKRTNCIGCDDCPVSWLSHTDACLLAAVSPPTRRACSLHPTRIAPSVRLAVVYGATTFMNAAYFMTYFCLLSLNTVTGVGVSYRAITHSTEPWPSVVTVHSLDARRNTTTQRKQQCNETQSNFLWSAKTQYQKNAQKSVAATYSTTMINESNKRKTQRRLQRTAVSVITHATYAIVLRKKFNATYVMHKIQRTHATHETTSHNRDTGSRGDSDQYEK